MRSIDAALCLVPKSRLFPSTDPFATTSVRVSQAVGRNSGQGRGLKSPPPTSPRQPVFYAVVQHDFVAERADELDAKTGDHISVVAQSNYEWFVAKPISRLGRPGLIPVSFVQIHDPSSGSPMDEQDVKAMMERGDVPGVEEWKKSILDYKATSISLGVLDDDILTRSLGVNGSYTSPSQASSTSHTLVGSEPDHGKEQPLPAGLPPGVLLQAEVLSWHFEVDEYWFRIHALYQPDDLTGTGELPPAKQLVLFRVYNDFYEFQVNLLKLFPIEAGQELPKPGQEPTRILPYMPGPSPQVDDKITQLRKEELDAYLSQFCGLWQFGAEHILRHKIVQDFFIPKAGDVEEDAEPAYRLLDERQRLPGPSTNGRDNLQEPFAKMSMQNERRSEDSRYEEQPYGSTYTNGNTGAYKPNGAPPNLGGYQRDPTYPRPYSPHGGASDVQMPGHTRTMSSASARMAPHDDYAQTLHYTSFHQPEDDSPKSNASIPTQPYSAVGSVDSNRSRSHSVSKVNSPPISASNPNTAFMKIKIFDRLTQELIAIRVNPRVTHTQLMDKVRARLGDDVRNLAYRNSVSNTFLGLEDDASLRQWLEGTDKHVLYAD